MKFHLEEQRLREENIFNTVFRNREGYREAREELESAGITTQELDMIQRYEMNNARRLLRNFGNRALENINLLRLILNVEGDRNPDDTEENRVILFTRLETIPYEKAKHGDLDSCAI